jgi:hypothetical protein
MPSIRTRLVGDSVPMLINGVSQQSEIIRLPTQVTEQINCTSSIVQGLTKRPPTEFVKQLDTNKDFGNAKVHLISRDENEQYIVVVQSGSIRVFDLEGNEHTVELNNNKDYITLDSSVDSYPIPLSAFRLHTVADTTFLVNRNTTVLMDENSTSPSNKPHRALIWIKSAKVNKLHNISIFAPDQSGTGRELNISVSYAPDADVTTNLNHSAQMLARELKNALEQQPAYSSGEDVGKKATDFWKVGTHTNIIYVESLKDDFIIHASNDWSDTYISAIKDTVGGVADLPSRGFPEMRIKVTGDVSDSEQGFWVKFVPDNEELQALDDDGFNTVTFAAADVNTTTDLITIGNHPFLSKPRSGDKDDPSSISGGERELVQYKEGSFTIAGLTDNSFYFVESVLANGIPNGTIKLAESPSAKLDSAAHIERPAGDSSVSGSAASIDLGTVAGITASAPPDDGFQIFGGSEGFPGVTAMTWDSVESEATLTLDESTYGTRVYTTGAVLTISNLYSTLEGDLNGVFTMLDSSSGQVVIDMATDPGTLLPSPHSVVTNEDPYFDAKLVRVRVLHGKWVESVAPSSALTPLLTSFLPSTMPHLLVRTAEKLNDRFVFRLIGGTLDSRFPLHKWGSRIVGDADSSPDPTFVGNTINDVFEWKQSLGFASGQNFILSERSQHFNFWPITVATALEDARIDVAASGSNMSNFHSIRVFQDELVGFTNEGQFTLSSSGTTLTPETVSLSQTTKYESSETAQPINIGSSLAFATSRGGFSAISEYFIREDQMAYVNENTRHCAHYIKGDVTSLSASPISDSVAVLTNDDSKVIYFYQWYWQGNEKVQSSWSKWTFGSDIISATFVKDILYLIMQAPTGTLNPELYKIVLTAGDTDIGGSYKTSLDRRVLFSDHASATVTLPYTIETGTMKVVDSNGRVLTIASQEGETITLSEPVGSTDIFVGEVYDSEVEFTRPVMRSRYKENVDLRARLQVQDYVLYHQNTGYMKVKVYPKSYTETPYEYEMDNLLGGTTLGSASIVSRGFKVPVRANAREMRLTVNNDSHFPHHLVSAEWSASYNPRIYRQ